MLPVSFRLDGERILVRTGQTGKLRAALRDAVVAFEADDVDPLLHSGWSVAVTGVATEIDNPIALDHAPPDPDAPWAPVGGEALHSISTELLSGRRTGTVSHPVWG